MRPPAIRFMAELGIDISSQQSKTLDHYLDQPFDEVITMCDQAKRGPSGALPARERERLSFPDPTRAKPRTLKNGSSRSTATSSMRFASESSANYCQAASNAWQPSESAVRIRAAATRACAIARAGAPATRATGLVLSVFPIAGHRNHLLSRGAADSRNRPHHRDGRFWA